MMEKIEKAMGLHPIGRLKILIDSIVALRRAGINEEELRLYLDHRLRKRMRSALKHCFQCGQPMKIEKITTPKGKANLYGYKSAWVCTSKDCPEVVYSTKNVDETVKEAIMAKKAPSFSPGDEPMKIREKL